MFREWYLDMIFTMAYVSTCLGYVPRVEGAMQLTAIRAKDNFMVGVLLRMVLLKIMRLLNRFFVLCAPAGGVEAQGYFTYMGINIDFNLNLCI